MVYKESASMVYKVENKNPPIYLTTLFNRVSSVTNRTLRNSSDYQVNVKQPTRSNRLC